MLMNYFMFVVSFIFSCHYLLEVMSAFRLIDPQRVATRVELRRRAVCGMDKFAAVAIGTCPCPEVERTDL